MTREIQYRELEPQVSFHVPVTASQEEHDRADELLPVVQSAVTEGVRRGWVFDIVYMGPPDENGHRAVFCHECIAGFLREPGKVVSWESATHGVKL